MNVVLKSSCLVLTPILAKRLVLQFIEHCSRKTGQIAKLFRNFTSDCQHLKYIMCWILNKSTGTANEELVLLGSMVKWQGQIRRTN